ncbi:hypothetical protein AAF463_24005 (plasmid) [Pantoea sp. BJ2]|uniref:Uncharacterized protein n=1 Tax=Pantoea sp. BJ2 TaxID=3141322 RepID=A0AAU7U3T1_9GAMM
MLRINIISEQAAPQAYYDQFSESAGQTFNADISPAASQQFFAPTTQTAKRGLVNDYVWDARVGLVKNEAQSQPTFGRKFTGAGKWRFMGGVHAEDEFTFLGGVYGGLDTLFGGGAKVSVSRSEISGQVLGMTAEVLREPFILSYTGGDTNDGYSLSLAPSKVLGYRFSSFCLPPDTQNGSILLSQVIDPV